MEKISNEELVLLIQSGENVKKNTETLYCQNIGLISKVACRFKGCEDLEDLKQQATIYFLELVSSWDPDSGSIFSSYAFNNMFWRLIRYVQENKLIKIPTHRAEEIRQYNNAVDDYRKSHGKTPSRKEIASLMGISVYEVDGIRKTIATCNTTSLDAELTGLDGENINLLDTIPDPTDRISETINSIQNEELSTVMLEILEEELEPDEIRIIKAKYEEDRTFKEIPGDFYRNRNLHEKAIRKLKRASRTKKYREILLSFFDDYSPAYKGVGVGAFNRTWTSATERTALSRVN